MAVLAWVKVGNFPYFLFLAFLVGITLLSLYLCNRFGKVFAKRYISIILWANFALHFLKQILPYYYSRWPGSLPDSLFPNLCAVLIMLSPFIFHFGGKYWKDYMYYIGVLSGVLVYLAPTGAMREDVVGADYVFEMIRFYLCHWPLVVTGILMVQQGFHKLDWKRLWAIPVMFAAILVLISLDQMLFGPILKMEGYPHDWIGEDGLLNRINIHSAMSNQSMQFGPQSGVDGFLGWLYPYLIPGLMTYRVGEAIYFTPVIWIVPFLYLGTVIIGPLMALPFESRQMRMDVLAFQQKRKLKRLHRTYMRER